MQLPSFALERFFARHEFKARHLLCASDFESVSISELLSMEPGASEAFGKLGLGYTESPGSPSLRAAIGRIHALVGPEDILVTSGAEEAIFLFMHAALAPGDHLVVHPPCYQSLVDVARSIGCEVTAWQAREESAWELDPDDLPRLVRPSTRAIVLNVPHNPTGFLMGRDAFLRTLECAEARGLLLFSDEVYRGLERAPGGPPSPGVRREPERRLTGRDVEDLRAAGPAHRLDCHAERGPEGANGGAEGPHDDLRERPFRVPCRGRAPARRNAGDSQSRDHRCQSGAARCILQTSRACLLLAPGVLFGGPGSHFRIGFGRRSMPEALAELETFVERNLMDARVPQV